MVAAGRFAPGHLGELTQIVPFEMVGEALAETGEQRRVRDLPLAGGGLPAAGWVLCE
jgi:transposase IS4-like protein